MSCADQIADHNWDLLKHESSPRHQKRAVVELVGYCWWLINAGALSPEYEKLLRARVRNTCIEFDMDPPPEGDALEPFPGSDTGAFSP